MSEQVDLGALRMRYSGERLCSCGSRVVRCDGDSYNFGRCSGCGEEHFMHGVPYRDRDVLALIDEVERLRTTEVPGLSPEEVAANVQRGVPAFWAPWAMWTVPSEFAWERGGFSLYRLERSGVLCGRGPYTADAVSETPLIALAPAGPTLSPWGRR